MHICHECQYKRAHSKSSCTDCKAVGDNTFSGAVCLINARTWDCKSDLSTGAVGLQLKDALVNNGIIQVTSEQAKGEGCNIVGAFICSGHFLEVLDPHSTFRHCRWSVQIMKVQKHWQFSMGQYREPAIECIEVNASLSSMPLLQQTSGETMHTLYSIQKYSLPEPVVAGCSIVAAHRRMAPSDTGERKMVKRGRSGEEQESEFY